VAFVTLVVVTARGPDTRFTPLLFSFTLPLAEGTPIGILFFEPRFLLVDPSISISQEERGNNGVTPPHCSPP